MGKSVCTDMSGSPDGLKRASYVSSLPDYAQVFMFLRNFGTLLDLPPVSLSDLVDFFLSGHNDVDNIVVGIHWRLLTSVTRRESRKDWKKMARRFAFRNGITADTYSDIPLEKRVEIFKLVCEGQFDCNLPFRAELKKLDLVSDKPLGTDRSGHRYWLLKDSTHDVRLYSESGYDELPPTTGSWTLLARSVDELGDCITKLTEKGEAENYQIVEQTQGDGELESDEVAVSSPFISEEGPILRPKPQLLGERSQVSGSKHKSKKGGWKGAGSRMVEKEVVEQEGGCFLCGLDNDYQNMLLCDYCDKECHMYCLYPKLWSVPRGKWACPLCNERVLLERLKSAHTELATARYQYEKATERKQRSVIRLQKSGLLLQNIILSESTTERTRRTRKVVNYAELNDVYLPPLGPKDFVGSGNHPSSLESTVSSVQCVGTRASRRLRGMYGESEQSSNNSPHRRHDLVESLENTALLDFNTPSEASVVGLPVPGEQELDLSDSPQHSSSCPISNTVNSLVRLSSSPSHGDPWSQTEDTNSVMTEFPTQLPSKLAPVNEMPVWNGSWTDSSNLTLSKPIHTEFKEDAPLPEL